MSRLVMKMLLVGIQSSTMVVVILYLFTKNQFSILPGVISIVILWKLKCRNCLTSFKDERLYSRLKFLRFYDTDIINDCPVCGKAMHYKD
jgi:hypothetical protein